MQRKIRAADEEKLEQERENQRKKAREVSEDLVVPADPPSCFMRIDISYQTKARRAKGKSFKKALKKPYSEDLHSSDSDSVLRSDDSDVDDGDMGGFSGGGGGRSGGAFTKDTTSTGIDSTMDPSFGASTSRQGRGGGAQGGTQHDHYSSGVGYEHMTWEFPSHDANTRHREYPRGLRASAMASDPGSVNDRGPLHFGLVEHVFQGEDRMEDGDASLQWKLNADAPAVPAATIRPESKDDPQVPKATVAPTAHNDGSKEQSRSHPRHDAAAPPPTSPPYNTSWFPDQPPPPPAGSNRRQHSKAGSNAAAGAPNAPAAPPQQPSTAESFAKPSQPRGAAVAPPTGTSYFPASMARLSQGPLRESELKASTTSMQRSTQSRQEHRQEARSMASGPATSSLPPAPYPQPPVTPAAAHYENLEELAMQRRFLSPVREGDTSLLSHRSGSLRTPSSSVSTSSLGSVGSGLGEGHDSDDSSLLLGSSASQSSFSSFSSNGSAQNTFHFPAPQTGKSSAAVEEERRRRYFESSERQQQQRQQQEQMDEGIAERQQQRQRREHQTQRQQDQQQFATTATGTHQRVVDEQHSNMETATTGKSETKHRQMKRAFETLKHSTARESSDQASATATAKSWKVHIQGKYRDPSESKAAAIASAAVTHVKRSMDLTEYRGQEAEVSVIGSSVSSLSDSSGIGGNSMLDATPPRPGSSYSARTYPPGTGTSSLSKTRTSATSTDFNVSRSPTKPLDNDGKFASPQPFEAAPTSSYWGSDDAFRVAAPPRRAPVAAP